MAAPVLGDVVLYEGARWRVVAEGLTSLQRFGLEFKPVGEPYVVLHSDTEISDGEEPHELRVPRSRWDQVEVVAE